MSRSDNIEGIIYKLLGGTYYVKTDTKKLACRARGLFRLEDVKPLVGDVVVVQQDEFEEDKGYIIEVKPRKTELLRPPVANVNHAVIVVAIKTPNPNIYLLDKMLVLCETAGITPTIVINKSDLDKEGNAIQLIKEIYKATNYKVLVTNILNPSCLDELKDELKDKITVFAGPSGVGKSSLLNTMLPQLSLQTGEVSKKIKRGRHTTRHTELIELPSGGMVLDTPGFTSLDILDVDATSLSHYFPEFRKYDSKCKFRDCQHINEPKCAVLDALDKAEIHQSRYQSYKLLREQIENTRRNR